MRSADNDTAAIGSLFGSWYKVERSRNSVHTRPDGVGTKTHQQLENLFISTGTDSSFVSDGSKFFQLQGCKLQSSSFKRFHDTLLRGFERLYNRQAMLIDFLYGCDVSPTIPMETHRLNRTIQYSIGSPSAITAYHQQLFLIGAFGNFDKKSILFTHKAIYRNILFKKFFQCRSILIQLYNLNSCISCMSFFEVILPVTCFMSPVNISSATVTTGDTVWIRNRLLLVFHYTRQTHPRCDLLRCKQSDFRKEKLNRSISL